MGTSIASPTVFPAHPPPALSPIDRASGVIFGLIMALTFTGSLSVATADRNEVRSMLIAALGCNIAWGLVDAVMHMLAAVTERGRNGALLSEVRSTPDPVRARTLISEAMPPLLAATMHPGELDEIRNRLQNMPPVAASPGLTRGDVRNAVRVFFLVFLATFPVALPFLFFDGAHRALRVSNAVALAMLFVGGWYLGTHGGRHPLWSGFVALSVGLVLVWATIALGG